MSDGAVRCKKCHRRLTSEEAKAAGYGPVCYRSLFGFQFTRSARGRDKTERHAKREAIRTGRARKALEHQISIFEIEEGLDDAHDDETTR